MDLPKPFAILTLLLSLTMMLVGCQSDRVEPPEANPTRSMKGYELYSWQMQGDWYFALVVGTNRIKTYDEISSPEVRVQGLEALKGKLNQLPGGEQVLWSERWVPNTVLPPDDIVEQVKAYCEQRGIQLLGQAINKNSTSPVYVKSNGWSHSMVQIPGVSFIEPLS